MNQRLHKLFAVSVAALVLAACGGTEADVTTTDTAGEEAPEELTSMTYTYIVGKNLPALIAQEEGFFAEEGLEVELIETETGGAAIEAMMGGSTDITQAADARLPQAVAEGLPVVGIGVHNTGYGVSLAVAAENEDVQSWEDCVGQRVGATVGSGAHTVWVQYIEHIGLSPDDFEVTSLNVPDMPAALAGDSIDCALMWNPHLARAEEEGLVRIAVEGQEMAEPIGVLYPFLYITHEDTVEERPEMLQSFLNAMVRADRWLLENEDEAKELQRADLGADVSDRVNDAIFYELQYEHYIIDDEVIGDLNARLEVIQETTGEGEAVDIEDHIDNTFVEKAVEQYVNG